MPHTTYTRRWFGPQGRRTTRWLQGQSHARWYCCWSMGHWLLATLVHTLLHPCCVSWSQSWWGSSIISNRSAGLNHGEAVLWREKNVLADEIKNKRYWGNGVTIPYLIDNQFPKGHILNKLSNRKKLIYSCTDNMMQLL